MPQTIEHPDLSSATATRAAASFTRRGPSAPSQSDGRCEPGTPLRPGTHRSPCPARSRGTCPRRAQARQSPVLTGSHREYAAIRLSEQPLQPDKLIDSRQSDGTDPPSAREPCPILRATAREPAADHPIPDHGHPRPRRTARIPVVLGVFQRPLMTAATLPPAASRRCPPRWASRASPPACHRSWTRRPARSSSRARPAAACSRTPRPASACGRCC